MVRSTIAALLLLALAACGEEHPRVPGADPTADPRVDPGSLAAPPRIRLVTSSGEVELFQGSYCWQSGSSGVCADSVGPTRGDLVDAGDTDAILIEVGVDLDHLSATLVPLDAGGCAPTYDAEPEYLGEGRYRIEAAGPAGLYRVDLWGTAPQGEVPGYLQWRMPSGPAAAPEARLAIVWEPHGELEGQGYLLTLDGLPPGPHEASARITATAADGDTLTFDAGEPDDRCPRGDTLVFGETGTDVSDRVADLGPAPFDYTVYLALDGVVHHGTGTYPEAVDSEPDNDNPAPVLLTWDPPLPVPGA